MNVIKGGPTTSIESLDALLTANAELTQRVRKLKEEIEHRDSALTELQTRLNRYWDFQEDIDYRSLVEKIRRDARSVGEVLRALDTGTRRNLARLSADRAEGASSANASGKKLFSSIHSLLRTLDEWK